MSRNMTHQNQHLRQAAQAVSPNSTHLDCQLTAFINSGLVNQVCSNYLNTFAGTSF